VRATPGRATPGRLTPARGRRHPAHWSGKPVGAPFRCYGATLEERLWSKIAIDRKTGCHVWMGHQQNGYGRFIVKWGQTRLVHRLVWELTNGPIPGGLHVLHRCDNPLCCNPDHLYLGTHAENMADKVRKGRARNGATGKLSQPRPVRVVSAGQDLVEPRRHDRESERLGDQPGVVIEHAVVDDGIAGIAGHEEHLQT
jgi:HNH endonuclease